MSKESNKNFRKLKRKINSQNSQKKQRTQYLLGNRMITHLLKLYGQHAILTPFNDVLVNVCFLLKELNEQQI
jgi:hypothetical protein